jgi:hypothetical protein
MKCKSDVFSIFVQFKSIVEKKFNLPIVSLFSDNGGEFIKLKSFLANNGISHLTTPPHTPEVNGTAERRHRHVVETGRALLHHMLIYLLSYGLLHSLLQLTSSIECQNQSFICNRLLKSCLILNQTIINSTHLDACASPG